MTYDPFSGFISLLWLVALVAGIVGGLLTYAFLARRPTSPTTSGVAMMRWKSR